MKTYLKKISALLLALVMVMGMCVTAGAVTTVPTSNIEVTNLSDSEATTVYIYQLVYWDADASKWMLTDDAKSILNITQEAFDADTSVLTNAVAALTGGSYTGDYYTGSTNATSGYITTTETSGTYDTSVTFNSVAVGAYLIYAVGTNTTYSYMIAETYADTQTYMAAENVTLVAKSSTYTVTKTQSTDDTYVATGDTVTFTVTTTFPYFEDPDGTETYYIIDTPNGLGSLTISEVEIGGTDVTASVVSGYYDATTFPNVTGATTDDYIIDLSALIGTTVGGNANTYAGQTVVITYTAIVTATDGYTNAANAYKEGEKIGGGSTSGYSGGIQITKKDESGTTILNGAEFSVYKLDSSISSTSDLPAGAEAMYFVYVSDGVYRVATADEITAGSATQTIVATNGTVEIQGLEAGYYYHFAETKAPAGYSINGDGVTVYVSTDSAKAYTSSGTLVTGTLTDTKLTSLPSTGGFGTYLFTIVGVVVMAVMASLYFIKRRRDASEEAKQ